MSRKGLLCVAVLGILLGSYPTAYPVTFGAPVIDRDEVDYAYQITFIDTGDLCPEEGWLTTWKLWAKGTGVLDLQIFRPVPTGYMLVGENNVTVSTLGYNEFSFSGPNRIAVEMGDMLGFRYDYDSTIPKVIAYTAPQPGGGGPFHWTGPWPDGGANDVPIGGIIPYNFMNFDPASITGRVCSLAADVEAVPEPTALLLLAPGVAGLAAVRRRFKK